MVGKFVKRKKKVPHTGNTWPSRTCVIKEYQYYTISLSKYQRCCQYHKSMSIWSKTVQTGQKTVKNGNKTEETVRGGQKH